MDLRAGALAVLLLASCARDAAPSVAPSPGLAASPTPTDRPAPSPSATPTAVAASFAPRVTRTIAGMDFALFGGLADVRLDTALSREDERVVADTIAADVPAVEREFARAFAARPVIYVFAGSESYADGFAQIFGYPRATATFVAENSVSFFEPSLRLIAVNWAAVRERLPVAAIRHELTHLLTLDACAPRCDLVPAWLNEGQARLAEALVPGADWRLQRVRYEAASMAATGTLIPLNTLVSQLSWNALTEWAGYFKYQEAARAVELMREDIGGATPIARLYDLLRRGRNLAQAYSALTDRSFDDFVGGLGARMRAAVPEGPGMVNVAPASFMLYGFAPGSTVTVAVSGPRTNESWPLVISPFGSNIDGIATTRTRGTYTITVQSPTAAYTVRIRKIDEGASGDTR